MTRAAAALAATGLAALALAGCETTQEQSAKIGRRLGHQTANPGTTRIGAANRAVRVLRAAVVGGSPAAVAIELANTSSRAEAAIPVLISVRDATGAVVYRNDTRGIQVSIQQLDLLPPHASAWWVDNEVLAARGAPSSVSASVGAAMHAPRAGSAITVRDVSASNSFPGAHVDLTVHNGGAASQSELPIYAVAISRGRVVGAGRALVASLGPGASAEVEIPMTGVVTGATITVSVAGVAD